MKIGNKEKVLLFILAIMIVTALVVILAIMPMQKANAELQVKIKETQEQKQTIVTKLGENNINLVTANKRAKELEAMKKAQDGFFVEFDSDKIDVFQIQKYIYDNILEGDDFKFDNILFNKKILPEKVEGSPSLGVLSLRIDINKNSSSDGLVTVGQFYKFKENIKNIKSAVILRECFTYTDTSTNSEECILETGYVIFNIYIKMVDKSQADVVAE